MKYVKALGLAAVAVMALVAVAGAGTASATVFCEENVEPCPEAKRWSNGTAADLTLKAGTSFKTLDTNGEVLGTCNSATISWTITNAGGATQTLLGTTEAKQISWGGCTLNVVAVEGGELEFHAIAGTANGTVTAKGFRITISTPIFGSCVYGLGAGAHLGTLTSSGTGDAILAINAVVTKVPGSSPVCITEFGIAGEYTQKTPSGTPLFVKAS
jgi:hypothetical protein